jgi:hypothetical protein
LRVRGRAHRLTAGQAGSSAPSYGIARYLRRAVGVYLAILRMKEWM